VQLSSHDSVILCSVGSSYAAVMALTKVAILGLSLSLRVPSKFLRKFKVIDGLFFSAENIPSLGQRTGRTLAALHLETERLGQQFVSR